VFIFKVTEPSPLQDSPACAKRAAYPDPPPVVPDPESIDARSLAVAVAVVRCVSDVLTVVCGSTNPADPRRLWRCETVDATSAAEAAAHQSEGGAGEGRGKRVRKAPKLFGKD
jgi:hypothetical protein